MIPIKPVAIAIHPISRTAIEHALKPVTEPLPALSVSEFSYSEKLESAVERAGVATENIASNGLRDQLGLRLARGDLAVIAQAIPAWRADDLPRIRQLNDWVLQTRETSELRAQAEQMGRSLVEWLRNHENAHGPHRGLRFFPRCWRFFPRNMKPSIPDCSAH